MFAHLKCDTHVAFVSGERQQQQQRQRLVPCCVLVVPPHPPALVPFAARLALPVWLVPPSQLGLLILVVAHTHTWISFS